MKKQFLALIGGVMVAGLAMAAEVVGNNTAVVIQKSVVKSSTGFQFLCVPVAPLDITKDITKANSTETIPLKELLPPALYPVTTTVSPVNNSSVSYTVEEVEVVVTDENETPVTDENGAPVKVKVKQWRNGNLDAGTEPFAKGTIFWMNYRREAEHGDLPATVFCGQALDATKITGETGIEAYGNTSSEAKSLYDLIDGATDESWVYVVKANKPDYERYLYGNKTWWKWDAYGNAEALTPENKVIASGEAFYYQKADAKE